MREAYDRYSNVSIAIHWTVAVLVVANIVLAIAMEDNRSLFPWHKSIGITVLLLTLLRIVWRLTHPWPHFPERMPGWERVFSRSVHVLFYVMLLTIPLLGWAAVSAGRTGTGELYGFIPWFDLPVGKSRDLREALGGAHELAVYFALLLVFLHVCGALKHQFFDEDVVFHRMLPGLRQSHMDDEI